MAKALFWITPNNDPDKRFCAFALNTLDRETFIDMICNEYPEYTPGEFSDTAFNCNPVTETLFNYNDFKNMHPEFFFLGKGIKIEPIRELFRTTNEFTRIGGQPIAPLEGIDSVTVYYPTKKLSLPARLKVLFTGEIHEDQTFTFSPTFRHLKITVTHEQKNNR